MWPFRRKKANRISESGFPCSFCGSTDTLVTSYHGTEDTDYIRAWRGQRYVTCRCLNCKRDFYAEEPQQISGEDFTNDDDVIYDEEELRAAEEELRKQTEEEGDRRYTPY